MAAMAAGPICAGRLASQQEGRTTEFAYTEWETDADGNVNISIYKDAGTSWRGRGLADAVTNAKGFELWLPGATAASEISDYFEMNYTTGAKVYQLRRKDGVTVPDGTVIKMVASKEAARICWQTSTDDNGWGKISFEYLYGSSCAHSTTPDLGEEGVSALCAEPYTSDTYDGDKNNPALSAMTLTAETNSDGEVVITIDATVAGQEASFREADALDVNSFLIGGETAGHFFSTNQKDGATEYVLTPYGPVAPYTLMAYSGTLRWKTTGHSNCYKRNVQFTYTYGTTCTVSTALTEETKAAQAEKVLLDGHIYLRHGASLYDARGRMVRK